MEYTIKRIADKVGVSKTAVRKRIDKLGLQELLQTVDGKFVLDENTANQVIDSFNSRIIETKAETVSDNQTDNSLQEVITILREQLAIKDQQIADLRADKEQMRAEKEELQYSLQQAQALHAGTIQKQLTSVSSEEQQDTLDVKEKHWWQFWKK